MLKIFKRLRSDASSFFSCNSRMILIGLLFLTVSLIFISAFNVPIWLGSFRILPGGGLRVFFCYFLSAVFFFICGVLISFFYTCRKVCSQYAVKAMTDTIISYALRLVWIIVFFASNSYYVTLVCLLASIVFLVFAVICSLRISLLAVIVEALLIAEEIAMLLFNLKFIMIN